MSIEALNYLYNFLLGNSTCKIPFESVYRDLSRGLEPLLPFMKITKSGKFGHYVLPFLPNNCGPLYFSKIVKPYTT